MRVCSVTNCPTLVPSDQTKCMTHRREVEQQRGTRQARGYGGRHDQLRASWQRRIDAGEPVYCWRCKTRGVQTRIVGNAWHLGHDDNDRRIYRGPECVPCNTATAGR